MGPRTGLDDVEKRKFLTIPGLELRPLGHPARSQSMYRLRYPDFGNINLLNDDNSDIILINYVVPCPLFDVYYYKRRFGNFL
jgi:hypothetical protein